MQITKESIEAQIRAVQEQRAAQLQALRQAQDMLQALHGAEQACRHFQGQLEMPEPEAAPAPEAA